MAPTERAGLPGLNGGGAAVAVPPRQALLIINEYVTKNVIGVKL